MTFLVIVTLLNFLMVCWGYGISYAQYKRVNAIEAQLLKVRVFMETSSALAVSISESKDVMTAQLENHRQWLLLLSEKSKVYHDWLLQLTALTSKDGKDYAGPVTRIH